MSYYFICFVVSLILTLIYILKWQNKYCVYFTMVYTFIPIANFGYWQLSLSKQLDQAIMANKILYLGACFAPLTILLSILYLCKIKLSKWIHVLLFMFTMGIYLGALTVGYNKLFYKSVTLAFKGGKYILLKKYGPIHTLFYCMLVLYLLFGVLAMLYALAKKNDVSVKNTGLLLAINFFCIITFAVGRAFGGVELTAFSYDAALGLFLLIADRLVLYDVDETVVTAMVNKGDLGVASFDLTHNFLGCNDVAKKFYPVLEELRVDYSLNHMADSMQDLNKWIRILEQNQELDVRYEMENGRWCHVTSQYLYNGNRIRGYQFMFQDCTEEKKYEDHLIHISITDELTKLYNRRAFEDDVNEIKKSPIPRDMIIVSMDLNGLKKANDGNGHSAGDELIKGASICIEETFGRFGKVYRTGGDEFVCLLRCNDAEWDETIRNFRQRVAEWKGILNDSMAISVGVATRKEYPNISIEELEKKADKKMYEDKAAYYQRTGNDRRKN